MNDVGAQVFCVICRYNIWESMSYRRCGMKNRRKGNIGIFMLLLIVAVIFWAVPAKKAEAAEKRLSSITAVYTGDSVLVGHTIDLDKLTVMGLYSDGSYAQLKNYSLSIYTVTAAGNNTIRVTAEGVTGSFTVRGKQVRSVTAFYAQSGVTVGESLDREKVTVQVFYSDGTGEKVKDYTLSHTVVANLGNNEFTVTYEGVTAKFFVLGKEERKPRSFYVMYNGPAIIVGNTPEREDFHVTVFYNDNTSERITSFELTPSVIQREGNNTMVVSFGELSQEVKITGLAKKVTSLKAEYTGLPVVVGKSVATEDIKVTATFNDGTKDTVSNFTLSSSVVYKIGDNLITVFCDGKTAYINVRGVEAEIVDYGNVAQATIKEGKSNTKVTLAVGTKADPEQVTIERVDTKKVKKAMRRLIQTDEYMAFEVSFDDPELDGFLPMTMKLTVPAGYDKENFAVFYTPNRKTIMAQMNGEFLKDGSYEFKMFQPGTYIVADCTPLIYVESVRLEEEELTLRVGRSYSLDPEIMPHAATNKEVSYSSSRPQIVSVSKYGTLEALKTGTSIITVNAKDGSGKSCKLRVTVVEKKGKYDAEISEFADHLDEVETAYDFLDFYDELIADVDEKSYELTERQLSQYLSELKDWIEGWSEDFIEMDEDEWETLYTIASGWFDDEYGLFEDWLERFEESYEETYGG